ncbi:hypothetical protein ACX80U_12010 [Arthrobacter sp. TmT3-37]
MKEAIETFVPLSPFLLALLALFIPSAADRMKYRAEKAQKAKDAGEAPPVMQGKSVDFTDRYLSEIDRRDAEQEATIAKLRRQLENCTCGAANS